MNFRRLALSWACLYVNCLYVIFFFFSCFYFAPPPPKFKIMDPPMPTILTCVFFLFFTSFVVPAWYCFTQYINAINIILRTYQFFHKLRNQHHDIGHALTYVIGLPKKTCDWVKCLSKTMIEEIIRSQGYINRQFHSHLQVKLSTCAINNMWCNFFFQLINLLLKYFTNSS